MSNIARLSEHRRQPPPLAFSRRKLNVLLALYGRHVIRGEWRDYAIDRGPGVAVFSIFRNSSDRPTFTVMKLGGWSNRDNEYVVTSGRRALRRAPSLNDAVDVFERKIRVVSVSS